MMLTYHHIFYVPTKSIYDIRSLANYVMYMAKLKELILLKHGIRVIINGDRIPLNKFQTIGNRLRAKRIGVVHRSDHRIR